MTLHSWQIPVVIATFGAAWAFVTGPTQASGPCSYRGYATVAKDASGRVIHPRRGGPNGPRTYGCLYKFNNRVPLDNPDGDIDQTVVQPRSVRLAGWLVGYARDDLGDPAGGGGFTEIIVRSLHPRSGLRRNFEAAPDEILGPCDDCDYNVAVTDVVLRGKGAVAWIVCPDQFRSMAKRRCVEHQPASVYKADSNAKKRVRLDVAPGIDIFSLRLTGSTLSWTQDGHTRSASLR